MPFGPGMTLLRTQCSHLTDEKNWSPGKPRPTLTSLLLHTCDLIFAVALSLPGPFFSSYPHPCGLWMVLSLSTTSKYKLFNKFQDYLWWSKIHLNEIQQKVQRWMCLGGQGLSSEQSSRLLSTTLDYCAYVLTLWLYKWWKITLANLKCPIMPTKVSHGPQWCPWMYACCLAIR